MFANVERKLKIYAKINFICGILLALVCFIFGIGMDDEWIVAGIVGACCVMLGTIIIGWFIYAFAELLENVKDVNRTLKLAYADKLSEETIKDRKIEQERKAQEEKQRQQEHERRQTEEERKKAEKIAKQARIDRYWENHQEERAALLAKRTEAENKLKEMGKLAGKQRTALEDLIYAIDEELSKDREDG